MKYNTLVWNFKNNSIINKKTGRIIVFVKDNILYLQYISNLNIKLL